MLRILSTFLISLLIVSNLYGKTYKEELETLTPQQYAVLMYSLETGKEHNLGYTLAAIAWKESSFGKNKVNQNDGKHGSYGSHQILLTSAVGFLRENKIVNVDLKDKASKDILIEYLTKDEEVSMRFALEELKYWHKRHKGNYKKMIASYNAGNAGINSTAGEKYANDVAYRVKLLQEFISNSYIASIK